METAEGYNIHGYTVNSGILERGLIILIHNIEIAI